MVGRRDTGHRGQGDVRHGSHFKDMHKNPNEHVATCMGPNPPITAGAITACHQRALDS